MATYTVTLDANGVPDVDPLTILPGDQVSFCVESSQPAIICVNPSTVFGATRFEIPPCPHVLTLTVMATQPLMAVLPFSYKIIINDPNFQCSALSAPGTYPGFKGGGEVTGYQ